MKMAKCYSKSNAETVAKQYISAVKALKESVNKYDNLEMKNVTLNDDIKASIKKINGYCNAIMDEAKNLKFK